MLASKQTHFEFMQLCAVLIACDAMLQVRPASPALKRHPVLGFTFKSNPPPDYFLPVARGDMHGLFIRLVDPNTDANEVSQWLASVPEDFRAIIATDPREAFANLQNYLDFKKAKTPAKPRKPRKSNKLADLQIEKQAEPDNAIKHFLGAKIETL